MAFPIRLERDTHIINWHPDLAGWCTTLCDPGIDVWQVRSDGVLVTDYGAVACTKTTGAITGSKGTALGIHITGPEVNETTQANEFTLYSVQVQGYAVDENVRPMLFIGESPAAISNVAGGNAVADVRILGVPDGSGVAGGCLQVELTVAVKETTNSRNVCFGVAMVAGITVSTDVDAIFHLSVRRLVGVKPAIYDTYKV